MGQAESFLYFLVNLLWESESTRAGKLSSVLLELPLENLQPQLGTSTPCCKCVHKLKLLRCPFDEPSSYKRHVLWTR